MLYMIDIECFHLDDPFGASIGCMGTMNGGKKDFIPFRVKPKVDNATSKTSTVLTNFRRGNIAKTENVMQQCLHQRAGKGEICTAELGEDITIVNQRDNKGKTALMWR